MHLNYKVTNFIINLLLLQSAEKKIAHFQKRQQMGKLNVKWWVLTCKLNVKWRVLTCKLNVKWWVLTCKLNVKWLVLTCKLNVKWRVLTCKLIIITIFQNSIIYLFGVENLNMGYTIVSGIILSILTLHQTRAMVFVEIFE